MCCREISKAEGEICNSREHNESYGAGNEWLVNKNNSQETLEETVYESLKELEVNDNHTRNDPIMKEICKQIVSEIVMHAKNWYM